MKKLSLVMVLCVFMAVHAFAGLSLKFYGGMTYISGNDWNTGIDGWNSLVNAGTSHTGNFDKLNMAINFGGEVRYDLNKNFAIGLGAGYFNLTKTNNVVYAGFLFENDITWTPKINSIPIVLNFHYTTAISKSLNFTASLGGGYYISKFEFTNVYDNAWILGWSKGTEKFSSSKGVIGFQGAVGLEIALMKNIFLSVDLGGRYARMSDLEGTRTDVGESQFLWINSNYNLSEGGWFLWYAVDKTTGYQLVMLSKDAPSASSYNDVRKANIDLTGFAASIGLRISL